MAILNKQLSDTLCSIIATGFLKRNSGSKCIHEPDKKRNHELLKRFMKNNFSIQIELDEMKAYKPAEGSIVAQSPRAESGQTENINDDLSFMINKIEARVKKIKSEKGITNSLRGAYIGGIYDTSKLELLGPSELWQYSPEYREVDDAVERAYRNAKEVSNNVIEILNSMIGEKLSDKIRLSIARETSITEEYTAGKLFASVHGMTRSICTYAGAYNTPTILELALSEDTNKVGSCIPCALFMKSYGKPASAIHLGRGDNWNFPQELRSGSGMDQKYKRWEEEVYTCYTEGKDLINQYYDEKNDEKCRGKMTQWREARVAENKEMIAKLFLEALTFESSFIEKLLATFTILE